MDENNIPAFPESVTLMIRMENGKNNDDMELALSSVQPVSVPTVLFILETLKHDLIASNSTIVEGDFYTDDDE